MSFPSQLARKHSRPKRLRTLVRCPRTTPGRIVAPRRRVAAPGPQGRPAKVLRAVAATVAAVERPERRLEPAEVDRAALGGKRVPKEPQPHPADAAGVERGVPVPALPQNASPRRRARRRADVAARPQRPPTPLVPAPKAAAQRDPNERAAGRRGRRCRPTGPASAGQALLRDPVHPQIGGLDAERRNARPGPRPARKKRLRSHAALANGATSRAVAPGRSLVRAATRRARPGPRTTTRTGVAAKTRPRRLGRRTGSASTASATSGTTRTPTPTPTPALRRAGPEGRPSRRPRPELETLRPEPGRAPAPATRD